MSGSGQLKRPRPPTSTPIPPGRLCRLCGKGDFAVVNLEKKPEIVVKVRELLNIRLDLEADRKAQGYPAVVCVQCSNSLVSFATFKGNVSRAQIELEQRLSKEVEVEVEAISEDSPDR